GATAGSAGGTGSQSGSQSGGQQGATAVAGASATDPQNTIVLVRIDAPGDNGGFDQSNTATAAATAANGAQSGGATGAAGSATPVGQSSQATASATLERPSNVAVELRIGSDGNSTGGNQLNVANAGASAANASSVPSSQAAALGSAVAQATTAISNPQNTFVSIRLNSAGETGTVAQGTTQTATETVDGAVTSTTSGDPVDGVWAGESADGIIAIAFASDGENTDVRFALDIAGLAEPTAATIFIWTWDLVFGPGLEPDCTIGSETASAQVSWMFDCDPENRVTSKSSVSPADATIGSISWTWNWERGDLPGWIWNRQDILPLLTCPICTYVFNFNWLSLEPVELEPSGSTPSETKNDAGPEQTAASVNQTNAVSAEALASNSSSIVQAVEQTQEVEGVATQLQNVVQLAVVEQDTLSRAIARLVGTLNQSIALGSRVVQASTVTATAAASAEASIDQWTAQTQQGSDDSRQLQLAIQSATVRQDVDAIGAASLRDAVNSALAQAARVTQTVVVLGSAGGTATSSTKQSSEQLQAGADSEQLQVSGQWNTVDQGLALVAAAVLERTTNESTATGDTSAQTIGARSTARGTSTGATSQGIFQSQSGDTAIQSQEAYQIATIEQTGSASAGTSAGSIVNRYATPPAGSGPAAPAGPSAQAGPGVDAVAVAETAAAVAIVEASATTTAVPVFPAARTAPFARTAQAPIAQARGAARIGAARIDAGWAARNAPAVTLSRSSRLSNVLTQISSSPADAGRAMHVAAAKASIEAGDGENEVGGGSPRPTSAPAPFGASAGSAGTTSGGALAALAALFVLVAPGLGRRLYSQIGKRSAVFMLLDTRPG
ncbi:MAG: hypothetical protein MSC30_19775, partial [Gaiellaceae bacterium MAG52_C11]|nr:hypothetical protein [Candidatus Gaiellasilicea maunaloa]